MLNKTLILPFTIAMLSLWCGTAIAQDKFAISGTVKDASTGEDLIGVNILVKEMPGTGTVTNIYGFYSLTLPAGKYTIQYKYLGYASQEYAASLNAPIKHNVELGSNAEQLQEVVITAEREDENVRSTEISTVKIDPKEIETIPVLFGERDVLKTVTLLPGVKSAGEGNTGFFVRGGAADQNLILLDGAPVYNASHLLGFFSVFNSDALKDIDLIKGGMPAEYGGRLASVMDIKMKEGNSKKLTVTGGIGTISSKLTIETPLIKDKSSFMFSGRRTYADLFLKLSPDSNQRNTKLFFYDLNLKANYTFSDRDRLFLSGYFGRDVFGFSDQFGFDWGNTTGTIRWNHIYSDKLFSNTSLIYSNYNYAIRIGGNDDGFKISSTLTDWNFKQDYQWFASEKHNVKFGVNGIHHTVTPGKIEVSENTGFAGIKLEDKRGVEAAAYLADQYKLGELTTVTGGLRYSYYTALGPGDIFSYDEDGQVSDTVTYQSGDRYATYGGLEPRLAVTHLLDEFSSIKAGYTRTYQYMQLLSNSTSSSPTDIWLPSSNNIKPQVSDQVSLGYFRNFMDNTYEFSAETYYKQMDNLIDYRTGAQVTFNATVEGDLVYGAGRAYGLELFFKRAKGNFTGWVGYTISRTERSFDDIDDGKWFAARQDRLHDVSLVGTYRFGEKWVLSGSWVYYTGNAVTFPSGKYEIDGQVINYYTERNGYRMPDYHRMDLGVTYYTSKFKIVKNAETGEETKKKKRFEANWNFSIYNLYARENAYSISFRQSESDPNKTEAVQLSLFKIIPSITYNFSF